MKLRCLVMLLCGLLGVTTTKAQEKEEGQQKMTQEEIAKIMKWSPDSYNSIKAGEPFPDYVFTDIEGKKVKVSKFKGKYVVIDVWATWCGPCREAMPSYQKLAERMKGKKIVFLSLSIDSDKKAWEKLVKESGWERQLLVDEERKFVTDYYGGSGGMVVPYIILIDKKGKVVKPVLVISPTDPKADSFFEALLEK